jgi:hypothetical protein
MKALIGAVVTTILLASPAHASESMKQQWLGNMQFTAGIGIGNFSGDLGSITGAGISWNGRLAVNPWPWASFELNYQGVNTNVGAIIPAHGFPILGQSIMQNEGSVDAVGGYPFYIYDHVLKPYGFVGLGGAGVSSNAALASVGLQGSTAFAVPFGVGASYDITRQFLVDTRFTYNIMTGARSTLAPSGDAWNVAVDLGARFGFF